MKSQILLKGTSNQHVLCGKFIMKDSEFSEIEVLTPCLLKHVQPNEDFSNEHHTLEVEEGLWVMGKQIEYNPFDKIITQVWD